MEFLIAILDNSITDTGSKKCSLVFLQYMYSLI